MNTKNKHKKAIGISLLSLSVLSMISVVGGTAAWYQYLSRAGMGFGGTSIGNSKLLEIGFISQVYLSDYQNHDLSRDDNDPTIYWSNSEISEDTLTYYLEANGYASNKLSPTSSGSFDERKNFSLVGNPFHLETGFNTVKKSNYIYLPLVFRVKDIDGNSYVSGQHIYLNNSSLTTRNSTEQALRVFMQNEINNFIYNPSSVEDGSTTVGGVLNLNNDIYIDYKDGKEFVYGEYESIVYSNQVYSGTNTVNANNVTTFNANHKNGVYTVDMEKSVFKTANYLGTESVISQNKVLAITDEESGLAKLNLTIYLEGWDDAVIDQNIGTMFSLNLNFGVDNDE